MSKQVALDGELGFLAHVAEMARSACAPEWWDESNAGFHMGLDLQRFAAQIAEAEREACAKLCDGMHDEDRPGDYAWAIRARGKP